MQERLKRLVEHPFFTGTILALILINAVVLGLEAMPEMARAFGPMFGMIDEVILWIFAVEIALRIGAHGSRFFRQPWSWFDFVVVALSFFALTSSVAAFRALRVLRVLRVISAFSRLRTVVGALLESIPGIAFVGLILLLILYVASILATNLFGSTFPDLFGGLGRSMLTLFEVMTLEGWPDKAERVMTVYPWAWVFFVVFILIGTFMLLNLFVAIIVEALQNEADDQRKELMAENKALRQEMSDLKREVRRLNDQLVSGR